MCQVCPCWSRESISVLAFQEEDSDDLCDGKFPVENIDESDQKVSDSYRVKEYLEYE